MTTRTMATRTKLLNLKVSDDELDMLRELAAAEDAPMSRLVRRWIQLHHAAAFGEKGAAR